MYSNVAIKVRVNKRKYEYFQGDRTKLGVYKKDGELSFRNWGGFTGKKPKFPVKICAEGYTYDHPNWIDLESGEALLGSWEQGWVFIVIPFQTVRVRY